ncbi:glycosyltransferase family 2 protein [Beijerinckia indica]|uniref:Glycosyl transferase family 2 n=1 Tax=Beijerinckia indica subsp. indica (strain ATCC 9039 / DSM 1715 / NCIMB 8712) TaxID=395963 RepID=B2IDF4_BEII9|nr:glycosyltransferase family A protein [Beijerinckia indica]ACB94006.1 glycosyl transferase family 2 [Beijerinckia indica subsp. indica ATCC 9039]
MSFQLQPPLVSLIILNYNYGRFLRDAIASAQRQTYLHKECIIVDDASTDDSHEILDQAQHDWPDLQILKLNINSGQSAAALAGLARAKGDYILFLDADDILFPECVAHHLSVHMSSRRAVGFSCCDAMQIVGERMVIARNGNISASFLRLPMDMALISDSAVTQLASHGIYLPATTPEMVRYIPPNHGGWPWSTTSSMFFRKEALDLIRDASGLHGLRIATDNYLAHAINFLTGSLILNEQLVGYRLHGGNGFNKRPALDGFICHNRIDEHFDKTCRVFLDDLMTRYAHYSAFMDVPERILEICLKVDVPDTEPGLPYWAARSRFAHLLMERYHELEPFVGRTKMQEWMRRANIPIWIRKRCEPRASPQKWRPLLSLRRR